METKQEKTERTLRQNKAMHLYFTHLAKELSDAGLDMKKVLEYAVDIPWTSVSIKECLWRNIMITMFNKTSTTELDRNEVTKIYEVINRLTAGLGVSVEFPSEDNQ